MRVDYLKYEVEQNERDREFVVSIKTTEFRIALNEEEGYMFIPTKDNKIKIDMDTGIIKNLKDVFAFLGQKREGKDMTIGFLLSQALGFEFEMSQAYEKGLYYRALKKSVRNEI